MKAKKIFSIILSAVMTVSCLPMTASAEEITDPEYVEGEIVISSTKEVEDSFGLLHTASESDPDVVEIDFDEVGITDIEKVENYSEEDNMYIAEVDGDVEEICEELSANSDIIAEPNYILHTCSFTMPTEITKPVSFYTNYQQWYLDWILDFPDALETHQVTGAGVTIAIVDDGYNINASDFPTNLWRNSKGTVGWNVHSNNDNIAPIYKSDGTAFGNSSHGSNVAGVIGMASNGSSGIGVAYGAELMLIQAAAYTSDSANPGFTSSDIAKAINYAVDNGADIINLSLGSTSKPSVMTTAINNAYNAGVAIFAAAGNGDSSGKGVKTSTSVFYPAGYSNVMGVMAIDKITSETETLKLSQFSNYDVTGNGTYYNIAVPGVSILGCGLTLGAYTLNNGTSQASPLAAGIAALYYERYPDKTVQDLYSDILASSTDTARAYSTSTYKFKVLNAKKLLDYCTPPEITVNLSTDATIDGNYFYGLNEGYESISDYISVTNGSFTFVPSANGNGTGSVIKIYDKNGSLFKTLNVVVFGDINGDSIADAQDAVFVKCITEGLGRFSAIQKYAGDVTFDALCDSYDAELIENYAIGTDFVYQTR